MPRPPDAVRASRRWFRRRPAVYGPWVAMTRECVEHRWVATCEGDDEAVVTAQADAAEAKHLRLSHEGNRP